MPDVNATLGADFVPMLAGAVVAPIVANFLPLGGTFGPLAPAAVGLGLAAFGKGAVKNMGQGALLVSAVGLLGNLLGAMNKGAGDAFDF